MHFTLEYSSARCKYFTFPNPYLRIRMLLILLYVLSLVTAMPIQSGLSHPSPNILQLTSSILKSVRCISKIRFWYLTKYLLLCLNCSIQVNCLPHTHNWYLCTLFIVHTSKVQWYGSQHPPYLDVWRTSNSIVFSSFCEDPGVSLECRPIQIWQNMPKQREYRPNLE